MAWSKSALQAKQSKTNVIGQDEIDAFFAKIYFKTHPYLTSDFQKKLDQETNSQLSSHNVLELLLNKHSLHKKIKLISNAKHTIYITTFHIICDQGGKDFVKALIQAAQKGIDVRFLTTGGPWQWWYSGQCTNDMANAGIKVAQTPYSIITNNGVVNLHDKILVVDGQYFEADGHDRKFRDTDVFVEGPVVNTIAKRFVSLWRTVHAQDATIDAYQLYASEAKLRIAFQTPQLNLTSDDRQRTLWDALAQVADKPGGRVLMLTNGPGFVNSEMTPYGTGTLVGYYLLGSLYDSTVGDKRIEIFAYRSWIHSKVYYFDGLAVGIGSFNLDESGTVWTENTLICIDPSLLQQTAEMFKNDFAYSIRLEQP